METVKEYFPAKCFSRVGYIGAVFHIPVLLLLFPATVTLRSNERLRFSCQSATHLRGHCLVRYDEQYTPLPLSGFVLLSFFPLVFVCITYSWCFVKSQVDALETALEADPENPRRRPRGVSRRVFYCYFTHLFLRCLWGILCAALQKCVFYPAGFPAEFSCVTPTIKPTVTSTNSNVAKDYSSVKIINCDNSVASDKTLIAKVIFVANVMLALLVFGEMCYLLVQGLRSKEFTSETEFCQKHFWNKKTLSLALDQAINRMREDILRETETIEPLIAESDGNFKLDDNFIDLVIYSGRAEHKFTNLSHRHEIFKVYLKPQDGSVAINTVKDLFLPNKDTKNPCKILVVGRPGIGKSLLCAKISRDWAKEGFLCDFQLFYLTEFRWFDDETLLKTSLKKLLCCLHPEGSNDDDLFQYALDNPEKVIIVFDGFDEFKYHSNCQDEEKPYGNNATEQMPLSALYVKLVKGKLLPGATILTTSRPDAVQSIAHLTALHIDRKVEIMGFTPEKVEKYVRRPSAYDKKRADKIWLHISNNLELQSLCYIPVNTRVICSLLDECLKHQEQNPTFMALPSTSTQVYKGALKMFIFKHHPEFKGKQLREDFLMGEVDFPNTVEKTLDEAGALAKEGIEQGRLVFDSHEVNEMENCGLFNRMPNRKVSRSKFKSQFCFIHLTFQEFLAARVIAKMKPDDLKSFVRENALNPKWHLVLQFVAGLLGCENNEAVSIFTNMLCDYTMKSAMISKKMLFLAMKCLYEYNDEATTKQVAFKRQSGITSDIKIDLCNIYVTALDCAAIAYFLRHLHGNIELHLGTNHITDEGVPYLCAALKDEHCKLTKLDLGYNKISKQGASLLCAALKGKHCKLTELELQGNDISDQGVSHLSAVLKDEQCELTSLNLACNEISASGVSLLCVALKDKQCELTSLNLARNAISASGVSLLCVALKDKHCKLKKLNLCNNKVSDQGVSHLCVALKDKHCKLEKLDLSSNKISDQGVFHLCAALKDEHCKLTELVFRSNNISNQGVTYLCAALKDEHCKLTKLDISSNSCLPRHYVANLSAALEGEHCKCITLKY